ncbi:hypothetical protein JHL21_16045 [Devosia sp. WQ 349]|uniref:hypothetical protein n=1 Tax=Devosia sp. WQ 349K1 TaxID=2800329 RepID=UPI001908D3E6|nr:hypothetical protein [Devosia sp. WQ 349K1]MBK1796004.1 hypothetical protein [Devosia sp. WQ 349K1]
MYSDRQIAFIVERPLQIVNAIAIGRQNKSLSESEILVADNFDSAIDVFNRLVVEFPEIRFSFHESYGQAIGSIVDKDLKELFVHWDVGFRTQPILRRIKHKVPGIVISVFEEGVGTYRQDIYSGIKKKLFWVLQLPLNIGGSRFTDKAYVYSKNDYISNSYKVPAQVIEVERTVEGTISDSYLQWVSVFGAGNIIEEMEESGFSDGVVYLGNWDYLDGEADKYFSARSLNILKLHPYCKARISSANAHIAPKSVPAELLLHCASRLFDRVIVYHKGSSVERYIASKNVEFVDVSGC